MIVKLVCIILGIFCSATAMSEDEMDGFLQMSELFYEDQCNYTSTSEWAFINDPSNRTLLDWEEAQKQYDSFKKGETQKFRSMPENILNDSPLKYRYNSAQYPGDALLDDPEWIELISFSGKAEMLRLVATYSEENKELSRQDAERLLSVNSSMEDKLATWSAWHHLLTPLLANYSNNLAIAAKAARANNENDVTQYWEMLSGYPNGYEKMKTMWEDISETHEKLKKFVQSRLSQKYGVTLEGETIPAHLLGSLDGYDWTFIAPDVIPYPNITYSMRINLWKKNLFGKPLYKSAATMGKVLLEETLHAEFLEGSRFNGRCPAHLLNFCKRGIMKMSTCSQASISNYLSAHEIVAKAFVNQMTDSNTPILTIANRYSILQEGVAQIFSVLSVSPAQLKALGLVNNDTDSDQLKIASLMITALNVLPRLAYYLSVDLWRIDAINNKISNMTELTASWWKYRSQYEGIVPHSTDVPTFLDDSYVTSNKPYLPKFVGTFLAFQLYEYLMDGATEVRYNRIAESEPNPNFINMIKGGGAGDWSTALRKYLEMDGISVDALSVFFEPLEDYFNDDIIDSYPVAIEQEAELAKLQKMYSDASLMSTSTSTTATTTTTTSTSTTTTIIPTTTKTAAPKLSATGKNATSKPVTPNKNESSHSPNIQADKPDDSHKLLVKQSDEDSKPLGKTDDESGSTPKINTSKAVWAVAAVLGATILICVIALFGRRRCRKTPKNRRYV